jgi:type IV secretory pathway TrbD component
VRVRSKRLPSRLDQGDRKMLATTGTLLCGLGVLSVALEATWPAGAFGAVGMWMISHAA